MAKFDYDLWEDISEALYVRADSLAETHGNDNGGYAILNIGEIDAISELCSDIATIIVNAISRKK